MLTVEQNEELTQVGPGTPMGELLRRYWYPIAFEQDFDHVSTKTVRLLSENWTLFKTPKSGKYGIVAEACPHRRASLTYGVVHEDGIRCGYHGWKWDFEGNCLEQPAEADNQNFRDRVKQKAGKAEVMGGMVWVYVGPDPAPELPRYDVFVMDGIKDCGYTTLPSNWLQIMENSVDPHHVEWLHGYYFEFLGQTEGFDAPKAFQKKHMKTGFEEMEWGILKRRVLEGSTEENDDWKIGHPLVFPYFMRVGGAGIDQMQIRVPIDDTTTWKLFYSNHAPEGGTWEPQERPGLLRVPLEGRERPLHHRLHRGPGHHGLGVAGPDHRSHPGAPRSLRRRRRAPAQDVQGEHEEGGGRPGPDLHRAREARHHQAALREGQVRRGERVRQGLDHGRVDALQPAEAAAARPPCRCLGQQGEGGGGCLTSTPPTGPAPAAAARGLVLGRRRAAPARPAAVLPDVRRRPRRGRRDQHGVLGGRRPVLHDLVRGCGWFGEVVRFDMVTITEVEH